MTAEGLEGEYYAIHQPQLRRIVTAMEGLVAGDRATVVAKLNAGDTHMDLEQSDPYDVIAFVEGNTRSERAATVRRRVTAEVGLLLSDLNALALPPSDEPRYLDWARAEYRMTGLYLGD